jgi:DnaJ-class molecular chaperone
MNRDPRGFYAALHVEPDATPAEIQRSFRALMRLRHPDVEASSAGGASDGDEVRRILESFAVLRDPKSRAAYDPAAPHAAVPPAGTAAGGRDIPVRRHPVRAPVLRVTPVRWERGPL